MSLAAEFAKLSPTSLADALTRDRVMDIGIRPSTGRFRAT